MNKLFKPLIVLAAVSVLIAARSVRAVDIPAEESAAPGDLVPAAAMAYDDLLNKSLTDQAVTDFIARNDCSSVQQVQICRSAGVALWTDEAQKVESIYLYPGDASGFAAYQGQIPQGLAFTDTMEMVEQKMGHPVESHAPQAGWVPGLPDEGFTPDHFHYHAVYQRFGLTVIYNSPSAGDQNATIHAIRVTQ